MTVSVSVPPPARPGTLAFAALWHSGTRRERQWVFGLWLLSLLASVGLGLASVVYAWSGIPLQFGGVQVYITLYPPHIICLLWALCCGWWWGAIPAFLTTLILALCSGMPAGWALLFACADPLGFAVMTLGYHALPLSRALRRRNDIIFFINLTFVGSVFSSAGGLIWSYTSQVDTLGVLPVWQGWWLGSLVQGVCVVGPLLYLCWPALERWQQRRALLLRHTRRERRLVLSLLGAVVAGVLAYGFLTILLSTQPLGQALQAQSFTALADAAAVVHATVWVFFNVFVLIVAFSGYFGYRLFLHWQAENQSLLAQLEQANRELEELSRRDSLTGLYNRRVIDGCLQETLERCQRFNESASVLMLDIDNFKQVNDNYGHPTGDAVIRCVAAIIGASIRTVDAAGRYGGEEFVVVLPGTDSRGAARLARRICLRLRQAAVPGLPPEALLTISIGVAEFNRHADALSYDWLRRADQALYQAKQAGRNRVVVA